MLPYKIKNVMPENNYILLVSFTDGKVFEYDVKPLFSKWKIFNNLKDVFGLFEQVKIDSGGMGISWNDEIDLAADELRENGKEIL